MATGALSNGVGWSINIAAMVGEFPLVANGWQKVGRSYPITFEDPTALEIVNDKMIQLAHDC